MFRVEFDPDIRILILAIDETFENAFNNKQEMRNKAPPVIHFLCFFLAKKFAVRYIYIRCIILLQTMGPVALMNPSCRKDYQ